MDTAAQPQGAEIDLSAAVKWWLPRWWILAAGLLCGLAFGYYQYARFVPTYTASATVYISDYRALVNALAVSTGKALTVPQEPPMMRGALRDGRSYTISRESLNRQDAVNSVGQYIAAAELSATAFKASLDPLKEALRSAGARVAELEADPGLIILDPPRVTKATSPHRELIAMWGIVALFITGAIGTLWYLVKHE